MSWTTNHVPLSKSFVQKYPNICNTTIAKENSGPETRCPRLSTGAIFSQSRAWEWVSKVSTKWGTHHTSLKLRSARHYFTFALLIACARRDFVRAAVFALMAPRLAALSIAL